MPARGAYIPLHVYTSPSLKSSRLFTSDLGAPTDEPPLRRLAARLPRPSLRSAASILAFGFVVLVVFRPRPELSRLQRALAEDGLDYTADFDQLFSRSREGWRPYEPVTSAVGKGHRFDSWADRLSDECAVELVSRGTICERWPARDLSNQVDLVWTYSNGTDPLLAVWRTETLANLTRDVDPAVLHVRMRKTSRHFREHDELRYSVRSAVSAFVPFAIAKMHIVTADLPSNILLHDLIEPRSKSADNDDPEVKTVDATRIGQVPTWLSADASSSSPPLSMIHHSEIFNDHSLLPTFNSLSIESRFPFFTTVGSEFILYLNDDTFLLGQDSLSSSDIGSPVLGPMFRLQTDLLVDGVSPDANVGNPDGEWASLRRANWLLDRKFGKRERAYLAHIPKALSMPVLREIGEIWKEELDETASSRFRGRKTEFQIPFLATHYTIESHRQALLFAFVIGRSDRNTDGLLDGEERSVLLEELGFRPSDDFAPVVVPIATRTNDDVLRTLLSDASLDAPKATTIDFASFDGYRSTSNLPRPDRTDDDFPTCAIELETCFGLDFAAAEGNRNISDVFRRVAFEHAECGDCMIARLVSTSGSWGLSSFLPVDDDVGASSTSTTRVESRLNLLDRPPSKDYALSTFAFQSSDMSSRRRQAVREILRYTYALGDSKSRFHGMQIPKVTDRFLNEISHPETDKDRNITFLTLNDDFSTDRLSDGTLPVLQAWFNATWPAKSPYEK
ncbi:hypothetical protein JCM10212_006193 [Sporobolomyces blumeae]